VFYVNKQVWQVYLKAGINFLSQMKHKLWRVQQKIQNVTILLNSTKYSIITITNSFTVRLNWADLANDNHCNCICSQYTCTPGISDTQLRATCSMWPAKTLYAAPWDLLGLATIYQQISAALFMCGTLIQNVFHVQNNTDSNHGEITSFLNS